MIHETGNEQRRCFPQAAAGGGVCLQITPSKQKRLKPVPISNNIPTDRHTEGGGAIIRFGSLCGEKAEIDHPNI